MASTTAVSDTNTGHYGEILSARAHKCVQEVKLHKMMSTLDLSNIDTGNVKSLPGNAHLFESTKSVNMFPAFKSRRERSILDLSTSKSLPDRENLSSKLEVVKAEQRKKSKSMISLSGSKIRKKRHETPHKHPKVWSLHLSRTLPNITQCFTPLPPKTPYKNLTIHRDLREKKVTLSENSVALNLPYTTPKKRILPKTPPNSHRMSLKQSTEEKTQNSERKNSHHSMEMSMPLIIPVSARMEKKDTTKNDLHNQDKPEDAQSTKANSEAEWVTVGVTVSKRVDKTTMTTKDDDSIVRILTPSSARMTSTSIEDDRLESRKSERSLASRGGIRHNKLLPDMPKLRYFQGKIKDNKRDEYPDNSSTGTLPRLPEKSCEIPNGGRKSGPGFPKRPKPTPFKVPNNVFLDQE